MPNPIEPGNVVPSFISKEAWEAAWALDGAIQELFEDYGLQRREGPLKTPGLIAKMVQVAINRAIENIDFCACCGRLVHETDQWNFCTDCKPHIKQDGCVPP